MYMPLRSSRVFLLCKGIGIFHSEGIFDILLAIDFSRSLLKIIECAYVVQTSRMILMVVCQKYCIKMRYTFAKHLLPEVRACVHKNGKAFIFNEYARS